jgi:hypothetical protein
MKLAQYAFGLAIIIAALLLVGATVGGGYQLEAFQLGNNKMGAVRLDQSSGEICFFGVIPDVHAPDAEKEPPAGKIVCLK